MGGTEGVLPAWSVTAPEEFVPFHDSAGKPFAEVYELIEFGHQALLGLGPVRSQNQLGQSEEVL